MSEQDFLKAFANRLKYYLEQNDMTQKELAEKIGVTPAAVSNWCNGIKSPRMDAVDAMCRLFGCRREDFYKDPSESEDIYYLNPETAKVAQEIFDDKDLRALFDAARDSKPEDLRMAAEMLRKFKATNPDG